MRQPQKTELSLGGNKKEKDVQQHQQKKGLGYMTSRGKWEKKKWISEPDAILGNPKNEFNC